MSDRHTSNRWLCSALREFHVARQCRARYGFDDTFFSLSGNVIFANFRAARLFAQRINEARDAALHPELSVSAGELNAMGLVDEISHLVIAAYRRRHAAQVMDDALTYALEQLGAADVDEVLLAFVKDFPPTQVYRGQETAEQYLAGQTGGEWHRSVVLEELILLWLTNENPAVGRLRELVDDEALAAATAYLPLTEHIEAFFAQLPGFGPEDVSLLDMLRAPSKAAPDSWQGQLAFIRDTWGDLLGQYLYQLLSGLDLLEEENKPFFGFGPGPVEVSDFGGAEAEPEAFSPDLDWMPRVVMIAKNVYVWLDQLSRDYEREITQLDQIPDAELDRLARYGFTGLWLIGLWERSTASRRIKQIMGNPEAVASAYSLKEYSVAEELGGEAGFADLKTRAWDRGIRMASDMVPNHMGIDSTWVINHPEWFLGLDYSPFPTYTYGGVDLCDDERVGVYLEDHYYEHSDAAVTFQRRDHWTGSVKHIYHGNDGTQMPWNDTAQLDYLNPEVREAVIQTILDVARRSPIIRFDAAMTLTKRHYQRLWFPEPGTGGDIASRAEHGLTKDEFDQRMPNEFWREVVDRVAQEVPDTLLLAEAFWMMEGYFVRSLGMHRVYNSAFMNMLRDEKNSEYRLLIKNTLEFDPQILRRYVNFMNNPDERTAVDQFGKGDKYFGICTLMATMPGLPMFGHGQIEGYAEKYGMEYRKAYWDERPDADLVTRHEQQVFPLHHKRHLFAGVDDFYLYDFYTHDGGVDENVFAYSNRVGDERVLVLNHNRYGDTRGWVRMSAAYAVKGPTGEKTLVRKSLSEALGFSGDADRFVMFRDDIGGLEYLRNCRELAEQGLYAELAAYKTHVFVDFREIQDNPWGHYAQLNAELQGRGVPSVDEALREFTYRAVHAPLRMLVSGAAFEWVAGFSGSELGDRQSMHAQVGAKMGDVLAGVRSVLPKDIVAEETGDAALVADAIDRLDRALTLPGELMRVLESVDTGEFPTEAVAAADYLLTDWEDHTDMRWAIALGWVFIAVLGGVVDGDDPDGISLDWYDAWLLRRPVVQALKDQGLEVGLRQYAVNTVRLLLNSHHWLPAKASECDVIDFDAYRVMRRALAGRDVRAYLGVNRFDDVVWFNHEGFEDFVWWLAWTSTLEQGLPEGADLGAHLVAIDKLVIELLDAEAASGYRVDKLLAALEPTAEAREDKGL